MNMGDQQLMNIPHTDWVMPGSFLSGPMESPTGANDHSAASSDHASDASNLLGSPQWEEVQIASVAAMESHVPFNESSALWVDDVDEHHGHHQGNGTEPPSAIGSPSGLSQTAQSPKGLSDGEYTRSKSRGPFSNQALREETSITRRLKACVRCRMQKMRASYKSLNRIAIRS
jgi:hypothetical protein